MKKLFTLLLLVLGISISYAQETERIGSVSKSVGRGADAAHINRSINHVNYLVRNNLNPVLLFTYNAGNGLAGDTVFMENTVLNDNHYYRYADATMFISTVANVSTGDTAIYYLVSNDTLWSTYDSDTICTIECGEYETINTTFDINTLAVSTYSWITIDAPVDGRDPIKFSVDVYGYIIRD